MKEKTEVSDIDRSLYDFRNEDKDAFRFEEGLTEEIVRQLSTEKNDPEWMKELRLEALKIYNEMPIPDWGPSLDGLNMDNIVFFKFYITHYFYNVLRDSVTINLLSFINNLFYFK